MLSLSQTTFLNGACTSSWTRRTRTTPSPASQIPRPLTVKIVAVKSNSDNHLHRTGLDKKSSAISASSLAVDENESGGARDVYGEDAATEDQFVTLWTLSVASGYTLLRDPHHNKGLAFTERERDAHYLRGLLPPTVVSHELQGRAIFASGSPFPSVEFEGKTFTPGQANNAYIFPGFGLGLIMSGAIRVHDDMLLAASEALASQVTEENYKKGLIYPPFTNIRKISAHIAASVASKAYELGMATRLPQPQDLMKYAESCMYSPSYRNYR